MSDPNLNTRTLTGGVRLIRECTVCGEKATVSSATPAWEARHRHDGPHPAHSGHRFGGAYARAAAMVAGDPDWMNATGGAAVSDPQRRNGE